MPVRQRSSVSPACSSVQSSGGREKEGETWRESSAVAGLRYQRMLLLQQLLDLFLTACLILCQMIDHQAAYRNTTVQRKRA